EGVFHTESGVPIKIGGLADPNTGQVYYALEIPNGLSILAKGDPNAIIKGLDQVPREYWPNVTIVHSSFDAMVGSGTFVLLVALVFWLLYWRKRRVSMSRAMLWGMLLAGPLSFLAIECGWMVTEFGRQPWVIYGYLLTKNAVTPAPWIDVSFLVFSLIYILLAAALVWLLLRIARTPLSKEEASVEVQEPQVLGV